MLIEQLFGKTITNIYVESGIHQGWLDTARCYIEIDCELIIRMPTGYDEEVKHIELSKDAVSILEDLSDIPVYNIDKDLNSYNVEYLENTLKYIKNGKIKDFIVFEGEEEKGLFELDNGYIIAETVMSPSGTGLAGLNYYKSLENLIKEKGNNYTRLSDKDRV